MSQNRLCQKCVMCQKLVTYVTYFDTFFIVCVVLDRVVAVFVKCYYFRPLGQSWFCCPAHIYCYCALVFLRVVLKQIAYMNERTNE